MSNDSNPCVNDVLEGWQRNVDLALSFATGLPVKFISILESKSFENAIYTSHSGQECQIFGVVTQLGMGYDEECLPYYRVRFTDGVEIDAGNEEIFSSHTRFFALASAVCGGFAVARELDFVGPYHLQAEGSDDVRAMFLTRLDEFKITSCEQHFRTPAEFAV